MTPDPNVPRKPAPPRAVVQKISRVAGALLGKGYCCAHAGGLVPPKRASWRLRASVTLRTYATDLANYKAWRDRHGFVAMPATPTAVLPIGVWTLTASMVTVPSTPRDRDLLTRLVAPADEWLGGLTDAPFIASETCDGG